MVHPPLLPWPVLASRCSISMHCPSTSQPARQIDSAGGQALRLGLVDELGGLDKAIEVAAELAGISTATVEEYGPSGFWLGTMFEQMQLPLLPLGEDEFTFLRMLEGWQALPRY